MDALRSNMLRTAFFAGRDYRNFFNHSCTAVDSLDRKISKDLSGLDKTLFNEILFWASEIPSGKENSFQY
jgi:hypothetical protein